MHCPYLLLSAPSTHPDHRERSLLPITPLNLSWGMVLSLLPPWTPTLSGPWGGISQHPLENIQLSSVSCSAFAIPHPEPSASRIVTAFCLSRGHVWRSLSPGCPHCTVFPASSSLAVPWGHQPVQDCWWLWFPLAGFVGTAPFLLPSSAEPPAMAFSSLQSYCWKAGSLTLLVCCVVMATCTQTQPWQ